MVLLQYVGFNFNYLSYKDDLDLYTPRCHRLKSSAVFVKRCFSKQQLQREVLRYINSCATECNAIMLHTSPEASRMLELENGHASISTEISLAAGAK